MTSQHRTDPRNGGATPNPPKLPAGVAGSRDSDPGGLKVLLVDDHAPVLRFLSLAFSSKGCDVSATSTAEEALELISKQSFDLVVSDIKMPGLSGLDVLQAVKGQQPETPVVLITGAPTVDSAVFGLRHQAFDYLTKPFAAEEVPYLLERVRRDRQSRDELRRGPATVTDDLARRQAGLEGLSRIGALALQGLETEVFVEKALECTIERLSGNAGVIVLSDEDRNLTPSQKGDRTLAGRLVSLGSSALADRRTIDEEQGVLLTDVKDPFAALAALIPGPGQPMGILCLGRSENGGFLPEEKELLVAYARTIAVSLQKIVLGERLEQNLIDTISSFVNALESKDVYLKGHSARVSLYAGEIAKTMGLSRSQIAIARRVGILHDLGKIVVLDSILQKPSRLTPEEFALMKGHPLNAARILKPLRFLSEEAEAIKRHHERYDGKGYPDGLKGEQIPLPARIVTVADSLDAMTSNRPYRSAMPLDTAMAEIRQHSGAQFDPAVTEAFARVPLPHLAEISRFENAVVPAPEEPLNGLVSAWKRLAEVNS